MLFNSYPFLFLFLPLVLALFFAVGRWSQSWAAGLLAVASVIFYSWWNSHFTPILLISIVFNYASATGIRMLLATNRLARARAALILGLALDLIALSYFKYMNFFVGVAQQVSGADFGWQAVVLPIGISFFTFTQIAFLVDTYQRKVGSQRPLHYLLFVTYFPHLIAGPIIHHAEIMPQFRLAKTYRPNAEALGVGLTVLIIGLFKKVFIADSLATYADPAFVPGNLYALTTPEAWRGVLAYTLQIYFDFSAYCDMAIGVSRMLNITLPVNFESPYKAISITDFWRRWHMTLSRFLRDYLYIPLGGNRRGPVRRYANLLATMALGGLWHGAGWNFLIWGFLHGLYLCVNHAWDALAVRRWPSLRLPWALSWALTFTSVMVAWIFFRAPDTATALRILAAMVGIGSSPDTLHEAASQGTRALFRWVAGDHTQLIWLVACLGIVLTMPNLRQVMGRHELVLVAKTAPLGSLYLRLPLLQWSPNLAWAILATSLFVFSLVQMNHVSQFLYFQF
jgi:alginate O-acetyltransferase complex protein AlgI